MIGANISHYRIVEKLGEGGMGVVYKAEDVTLKRTVALKFLSPHSLGNEEEKERFLREAQAAAALHHPNACTIYEIEEADGQMFIAMAYLEGQDLAKKLRSGPLEIPPAINIAVQVAQGLHAAHEKGGVHRDIKPANIMLTKEGQAVIMDFGLAHLPGAARLTRRDSTLGTTAYMSPEQASGADADHRSDLWSLGVVLYEMVSGKLPFWGEYEQAILYAIFNEDPEPPAADGEVPRELQEVLDQALQKRPEDRYQSAAEMLSDLRELQRESEPSATAGASSGGVSTVRSTPSIESSGAQLRVAPSVAVLPFVNMSRDEEKEYFTDGVSEDIISALTKLGTIRVAARNSAFHFKGKTPDVREVGRKLKVDTVLTGSVRWAGDRLRLTVQLSNVADGFELWSERYDRVMDDIFEIQDEISHAVVEKLKVRLAGGAEEQLVQRSTENFEAYGLYLKGKQQFHRLTHEGFRKAIQYFEQAIQSDPGYVQAYTALAISYGYLGVHGWVAPKESLPVATRYNKKALELDDSFAEAHTTLAMIQHWYEWDFEAAESSYKKAIERNPGELDALTMYALLLTALGRPDEAVSLAKRALQWDPISLDVNRLLAYVYYLTRRYDEATEQAEKLHRMDPAYFPSNWTVAMAYGHKGDFDGAVAAYQRAVDLSGGDPISEAGLGWALGLAGRREEAQAIIDGFKKRQSEQYFSNYFIAWVYLGLQDWDATMEWLEKAYLEREGLIIQLGAESLWDPMREKPQFQDLLKRIGVSQPQ